ncbi:ctr copper transporter [Colletotrichum graminicola M1.001]|uniref:Copper transport protein n=1 Tax=Colletotrichum graminicola (strain M1.001 / M2 / FGSC 10212) TaxID=645133 RepID=E3QPU7_COLGM|nr:ctr copper transporter [Colletotrichum graminicola M1.001]EFQ32874.1 ctr copper transporter [Colletotrichum graminicola M1.001]
MDHSSAESPACKVSMLWNWNTVDACFLAESWQIKNHGMMAASCIGVVLLVVAHECLRRLGKEYDGIILRQVQRQVANLSADFQSSEKGKRLCATEPSACASPPQALTFRASPLQQLARAIIHAVAFGVAYIIMLLAMYFNGYVIISIIIGAGLGKFLCDWFVVRIQIGGTGVGEGEGSKGIDETTVCCS